MRGRGGGSLCGAKGATTQRQGKPGGGPMSTQCPTRMMGGAAMYLMGDGKK